MALHVSQSRKIITKPIIIALVIVALATVPVTNVNASSKPEIVPPILIGSGNTCLHGYDRTKDSENCKLRNVYPDHSLCTEERRREGLIFCDAEGKAGRFFDRNDNPEQYCLMHPGDD